jgi:poly-gamma-glutamate capsule biosynthesis protein CapA/YwtB (metallophosphatase superfamily)
MLGRSVAAALRALPPAALVAEEVVAAAAEADLFLLNLECCVSERGERWPDPAKPFFFRAPPAEALELLRHLGVGCVTLANNHALDYGEQALLDTLDLLAAEGIACTGAGRNEREARAPALVERNGFRLAVFGVADHPEDFAAGPESPGIAFAPLGRALPAWLESGIGAVDADATLVTPHWGPNMVQAPVAPVRAAAAALVDAGATLVAGHSAHVFHGVGARVLYDLGDFLDDYRTDPVRRNDLGLLFLVTVAADGPRRIEALPLKLEYCHTRPASGADAAWIRTRLTRACAGLGTTVTRAGDRLVVEPVERREHDPAIAGGGC